MQEVQGSWKVISYMEAFILWALVSFMLTRAEPGGLDTTFSGINYTCASKISSDKDIQEKSSESYSINPHQKISHMDYLNQERNCLRNFQIKTLSSCMEISKTFLCSSIIIHHICNMSEQSILFIFASLHIFSQQLTSILH